MKQYVRFMAILFVFLIFFNCSKEFPSSPATDVSQNQEIEQFLSDATDKGGRAVVNVMTYNIYVGANVDIVLGASGFNDLITKVAAAYDTLGQTNFPERAQAITKLIKKHRPHLIGLQEVSLIQRFDQIPPTMLYEQQNFLEILLNTLSSNGLNYQLADSVQNADVTLPRLAGYDPSGNPIIDFVRLVDADVILVRDDIPFTNPIKGEYQAKLPVQSPVGDFFVPRGYVSVEAEVNHKTYRFVNTHLEAFTELVRLPQAMELAAIFQNETLPTIMVGDFNTNDPTPPNPYNDATYQYLTMDYEDVWEYNLKGNEGPGYTSPFSAALLDPYPDLYQRLDLIFAKNFGLPIGPVQAEVIGIRQKDRTPSGLWPSDHAGVVAKLHLKTDDRSLKNVAVFSIAE